MQVSRDTSKRKGDGVMNPRFFALATCVLIGACGSDEADDSPAGGGTGGAGGSAGASGGSAGSTGGASGTGGSSQTAEEALRERLTEVVAPLVEPPFGTAAAVSARRGDLQVDVSVGTLWDGGPDAGQDTRFNVASVSKLLTAARIVSLAHHGNLGLDDPVTDHLPGINFIGVDGNPPMSVVTIEHLLRHRGGLPHVPPDLVDHVGNDWTSPDLLQRITESWDIQLVAQPGEYVYSNLGYALLGAIAELAGGCTFSDCMAGYLGELAMPQSTFWPATLTEAAAHGRVVQQGEEKFLPPSWYGSRYAIPFTGLWTTMPELAGFGAALDAASEDPASPLYAMTQGHDHGLGPVHAVRLGSPSLEHDGSGPGFYAALVVIPDQDVVVAVVTNGGNEAPQEVGAFSQVVDEAVRAVPEP